LRAKKLSSFGQLKSFGSRRASVIGRRHMRHVGGALFRRRWHAQKVAQTI
jgi:hypothetical protein